MRRHKRSEIAAEYAKGLMAPEDFAVLAKAISDDRQVIFKYTDRNSVFSQYRQLWPRGFYICDVPGPHTKKCY